MQEEGDQVQTWNVLFTKKITQKQKSGFMDGVATITYNSSRNITTITVVDEEGKQVTRGRIPPDKLPIDEDSEIVVSPVLIRFNDLVSSTNIPTKPERPQSVLTIQRPGLRRTNTPGFKPPTRITPIIHEKPPKHEEEEPIQPKIKQKREVSDELKKYQVQHFRGEYPKLNEEPKEQKTVQIETKVIKKEEPTTSRRKNPRTFEEILQFFQIDESEETNPPKTPEISKSPAKQHTPTKDILKSLQRSQSLSSSDEENDSFVSHGPQPKIQPANFDSDSDPDLNDLDDSTQEENPKKDQILDCSQIKIDLKWENTKKNYGQAIPETFQNYEDYKTAFIDSLTNELNVKIREVYRLYMAGRFSAVYKPPICTQNKNHGPMKFGVDKKGFYYYHCNQCKCYKQMNQDAEVPLDRKVPRAPIVTFLRSRGIFSSDAIFQRTKNMNFISIGATGNTENEFSKDDVWILILDNNDKIFCVSNGYGVGRGNKIYLDGFFDDLNRFPMTTKCLAIKLFNAQSEKSAIMNLYNLNPENLPILPAILSGQKVSEINMSNIDLISIANQFSDKYKLNECQKMALLSVAESFNGEKPILLVHGIFGAGKSHLLSVIVTFLDKVLTMANRDDKILIAATTNVAVDNVLLNLLDDGFDNLTRVGSVKNMSRKVLPYATGNSDLDELKTLQSMEMNKEVELAIKNAQEEKRTKTSKIDICRVTGVTCAACQFECIQNKKFTFVLLDECSQQPEPISFLPISFGCQQLICCGDPMQLPPTISSHSPLGLGRPLFSRLIRVYPPVMLSIQYRCHPSIADICSKLFYKGKVTSGVSEEDRRPLYEMPTVCLFNVVSGSEKSMRGSYINEQEITTVISLVRCLLKRGVPNDQIGVICFYKAQVDMIQQPLCDDGKHPVVDVSTVDAFQGDERDVIIISTCRTNMSTFVEMNERVNVAISRAKRHLFIVSNAPKLQSSVIWGTVFMSASKKPNEVFRVDLPLPLMWDPFPPLLQTE